jgi:cytochrome c oxidase cbb3-type subunit 3
MIRTFCIVVVCAAIAIGAVACEDRSNPSKAGSQILRQPELLGPLPGPGEAVSRQNPYGDDPSARLDGRQLFVHFNCAGCHGGHAGGGMGPSLRDADWIYGGEDGDVFDSIAQGRANGMPGWGAMLPSDYIWRLVAYIDTLDTPDEANPPQ